MTKIYLIIVCVFLFTACDSDTKDEEIINIENAKFHEFIVTLASGEKFVGIIDEDNNSISLSGLKDPSEIISVDFSLSEEVALITPDPKTRIGMWGLTETFRLHSGSNFKDYTIELPDFQASIAVNQATIAPLDEFGTLTTYHMIDLNEDPKDITVAKANVAFNEKKMNGIRFPLYCGDAFGGHPTEGTVIESVYDAPLTSLENAKAAYSGNEPFMIFLGIKVLTADPNKYFPDWVSTDADGIDPVKYAQLMLDFIAFMHKKGHVINAVAFDKEAVRMSTDNFKVAVDSLRARTERCGYVVPKIVGPELLDPQGDRPSGYLNTLYAKGYQDRFDIFGNHYYQRDHNAEGFANLKYEYDLSQSDKARPAWATEPHWNGNGDLFAAESALGVMFDHTDLGLEAFMWWDYPITGGVKFRQPVTRAYSDAIHRSIPIRMIDHDGEETFTQGKLHSRAYLRGNEVNVFLINVVNPNVAGLVPVSYDDYAIGILDDFKVDGSVTVRQWREDTDNDTGNEGETRVIPPEEDNQILIDIPTGSVTQLTFKIIK